MGRKRSRSWSLVTSGLRQEQIWRTSDHMSSGSSTPTRSNIKWGQNETKGLLEVLDDRLKKGMIWVDPESNKLADQVNQKSNTSFNDTHIKAQMKLLRHVYKYRGKDISSVRRLQASLSDADWNKFLHVFRHIRFRRGTFGDSSSSQATSEAEAGSSATTYSQVENFLEENSVGTPMYDCQRLYDEACEKLERVTLPRIEFYTFATACLFDERFLMAFMCVPDEFVFKFLNYRVIALRRKGLDIFNIK